MPQGSYSGRQVHVFVTTACSSRNGYTLGIDRKISFGWPMAIMVSIVLVRRRYPTQVRLEMCSVVVAGLEPFPTLLALEGLFTSMDLLMSFEVGDLM